MYVALQSAGKAADAAAFANKWINEHPKDATMPRLLAEQSQQRKDYVAARAGYERVLDFDPDNIVALNNLAWLLTEEKDPKGLEYAERAHEAGAVQSRRARHATGGVLSRNGDAKRGVAAAAHGVGARARAGDDPPAPGAGAGRFRRQGRRAEGARAS